MLILKSKILQIGSLEFKCFNSAKLKNMVFILKSCIYASLQLPLVLDNHSKGIDIPIWVRVISATSDKLREVILPHAAQLHSKVHRLLFSAVRKQLLPLA